jgi:hypothetical protein
MEFWPLPLIEELNHQSEDKGHPLREWPEPIQSGKAQACNGRRAMPNLTTRRIPKVPSPRWRN